MSASVSQVAKMLTDCFCTATAWDRHRSPPPPCTRCAPAVIHSTHNPFGEGRPNKLYLKCPDLVPVPELAVPIPWGVSISTLETRTEGCSNRISVCRSEASTRKEGCVDLPACYTQFPPFSRHFGDLSDHPRGFRSLLVGKNQENSCSLFAGFALVLVSLFCCSCQNDTSRTFLICLW